jgi:hypothetical protein
MERFDFIGTLHLVRQQTTRNLRSFQLVVDLVTEALNIFSALVLRDVRVRSSGCKIPRCQPSLELPDVTTAKALHFAESSNFVEKAVNGR